MLSSRSSRVQNSDEQSGAARLHAATRVGSGVSSRGSPAAPACLHRQRHPWRGHFVLGEADVPLSGSQTPPPGLPSSSGSDPASRAALSCSVLRLRGVPGVTRLRPRAACCPAGPWRAARRQWAVPGAPPSPRPAGVWGASPCVPCRVDSTGEGCAPLSRPLPACGPIPPPLPGLGAPEPALPLRLQAALRPFPSQSRRAHGVDLKGTVVIFDEAHNVVRVREPPAAPAPGAGAALPASRTPCPACSRGLCVSGGGGLAWALEGGLLGPGL